MAAFFEIATADRDTLEIAGELADFFMRQFAWADEPNATLKMAPQKRQALWKKLEIEPHGIDSAVVELMHRTHMGVDHDYRHLIMGGLKMQPGGRLGRLAHRHRLSPTSCSARRSRCAAASTWACSPRRKSTSSCTGTSRRFPKCWPSPRTDPELLAYAREKGAAGINIAGICCTANEVLMRHGLPIAGNFLQQELAILTGAVEVMVVDVQCVMPSLAASDEVLPHQTDQHLGNRADLRRRTDHLRREHGYEHACAV